MPSIARSKPRAPTSPIRARRSIGSTSRGAGARDLRRHRLQSALPCRPRREPALGQSVIEAAARALKPGGRFYMVANRGLPYEPLLKASFASFETLADNNKFRVSASCNVIRRRGSQLGQSR